MRVTCPHIYEYCRYSNNNYFFFLCRWFWMIPKSLASDPVPLSLNGCHALHTAGPCWVSAEQWYHSGRSSGIFVLQKVVQDSTVLGCGGTEKNIADSSWHHSVLPMLKQNWISWGARGLRGEREEKSVPTIFQCPADIISKRWRYHFLYHWYHFCEILEWYYLPSWIWRTQN